jgi:hypothetical protein
MSLSINEWMGGDDSVRLETAPQITLSLDEVRHAGVDGVDLEALDADLAEATFRRVADGQWIYDGHDAEGHACSGAMLVNFAAALDRVREYWRRRALAEMKSAEVHRHLADASAAAHEHAQLFAKIADDGVFSIDRAQSFRATSVGLGLFIREIERLMNSYKIHGDVP